MQANLFPEIDAEDIWRQYWGGMPVFIQGDLEPVRQIMVNFATEEDAEIFMALIDQKLPDKFPSIWYPRQGNFPEKDFNYVEDKV